MYISLSPERGAVENKLSNTSQPLGPWDWYCWQLLVFYLPRTADFRNWELHSDGNSPGLPRVSGKKTQNLSSFKTVKQRYAGGFSANSVGLPRVSVTKTPNLSQFQNAKQRYTGIFCQFTVHWTKISYSGHIEGTTKPGIPTLSRFTSLWQKYDVSFHVF